MSRNASGTYSLPAGNPVVSGTTIATSWANTTLDDLAVELTDSLSRSGKGGMTAVLKLIDGSLAAPGLSFASETGSGLFRAGASDMRLALGGVLRARFKAAAAAPVVELSSDVAAGDANADVLFNSTVTRTAGSLFQINNNGTEKFRIGYNGEIYKNGSVFAVSDEVLSHKSADQTISTTTQTSVTGMSFSVAANTNYLWKIQGYVDHTVGAANWSVQFTGPSSPTFIAFNTMTCNESDNEITRMRLAYSSVANQGTPTEMHSFQVWGILRNGANAGTVQLQAAADSGGTIVFKQGMRLSVETF